MPLPPAKIQRTDKALSHRNTLRLPPTFCIVEFLDNSDSILIKKRWEKFGFRDITPRIGNPRSEVVTFKKDKYVRRWEEFQSRLGSTYADWYYISGHHASQYGASQEFEDNGRPFRDVEEFVMEQEAVGFFNEDYHLGRWYWDARNPKEPFPHKPHELYMTMSSHSGTGLIEPVWGKGPKFQRSPDNPLLGELKNLTCRGMLLIGCNTFVYRSVRRSLTSRFPDAVIIGLVSKNSANSIPMIRRIFRVCDKVWFRDPTRQPGDPSKPLDPERLAEKIYYPIGSSVRRVSLRDVVSVMYRGKYYFPILEWDKTRWKIKGYTGIDVNKSWTKVTG